jgi:glycosyltransferase involved in cell wall biosynthesis
VTTSRRIAVVPARYGTDVIGGAEVQLQEVAHGLAERGWEVEVLTTCARDHFTWANVYPPGTEEDGKVVVRRFPAVVDTPRADRAAIGAAILAGQRVDLIQQQRWMNDDLRVPELFHYLLDHGESYRCIFFAPYLFWTTFACAQVRPERSLLVPALHDEPQAHLELFRPLFAGVRFVWFLTQPEQELGRRLFPDLAAHEVLGSGVPLPASYDPDRFRRRFGVDGRFVLYAGRREGGKGWEWLLDAFARAVILHDLPFSLVTIGAGEVRAPAEIEDRVIDLGFVASEDRNDALAAADAYLQPSRYESFSRTVMEAWLAGTLVIANEASDVVRWHCERSGAGLTFGDAADLAQSLCFLADESAAAAALAARGRAYVLDNYQWSGTLDRIEAVIDRHFPAG